jgi:hypothetical protein
MYLSTLFVLFLCGCDTSIDSKIDTKLKNAQHEILSPTGDSIDQNEKINKKPNEQNFDLSDVSNEVDPSTIDQSQLIPIDQFNSPHQSKLKSDVEIWKKMDLETYESIDGTTIKLDQN